MPQVIKASYILMVKYGWASAGAHSIFSVHIFYYVNSCIHGPCTSCSHENLNFTLTSGLGFSQIVVALIFPHLEHNLS